MTKEEFAALAAAGPLLLDGATGSNLYKAGMPRGVCTEEWILENPEAICKLHRAYAEAGSKIIYAPTFSANRAVLVGYLLADRLEEINAGIMELTKKNLEGSGVLVAGDLTTTGKSDLIGGYLNYEGLIEVYKEQIHVLVESGADLLVAETMMSLEETQACMDAASEICDLPVMCTLSLTADGRALFDGTGVEAVETLQEMGAAAVGLNCSVGPDQLQAVVASMKKAAKVPIIAKPNAGMPEINEAGEAVYSMTPEQFAQHMEVLMEAGAGIVGGCCGTTPEFIRVLREKISVQPRG